MSERLKDRGWLMILGAALLLSGVTAAYGNDSSLPPTGHSATQSCGGQLDLLDGSCSCIAIVPNGEC